MLRDFSPPTVPDLAPAPVVTRRHTLAGGSEGSLAATGSGVNDDSSKEGGAKKKKNLNILGKLFRKTLGRKQGRRKSTL